MAFVSLLTGTKGSPYTVFWIYAAYLSYKGDIKTLKSYLVVLIWINAIIAVGVFLFVDLRNLQWIMPGAESHFIFLVTVGIPLAIKIAILMRINNLINAENENKVETSAPTLEEPPKASNWKTASTSSEAWPVFYRKPCGTFYGELASAKKIESMEDVYGKIASQQQEKIKTTSSINERQAAGFAASNSKINEPKPINNQPSITDWELALDEYNGSKRNNGLWAKIFAENNGDENSTKAQYLKIRAAEISQQRTKDESTQQATAYGNASNSTCIENDALNYHQSNFKFQIFKLANGNYAIYNNWKYKIYSSIEYLNNAVETYERTELFSKEGLIEEYTKK